jgi:hypothetical protein
LNTWIQYNANGFFGADQNFIWDRNNVDLYVKNVGVAQGPTVQVVGSGGFGATVYLQALDSQNNVIASQQWGTTPSGPPFNAQGLTIDSYASRGSYNTPAALQAGDILFTIWGEGNDGTGNASGTSIVALVESNWTASNCATALTFLTNANPALGLSAAAGTERMRITSIGNVGIGNAAPLPSSDVANFLIVGSTTSTTIGDIVLCANESGTSAGLGSLVFANYNITAADKRVAQITGATDTAVNSGFMSFLTWSAGAVAERMRITSAGNVGIGTASPSARLHVKGISTGLGGGIRLESSANANLFDLVLGADNSLYIQGTSLGINVTQSGNVGIGAPPNTNFTLDSNGTSRFGSGNMGIEAFAVPASFYAGLQSYDRGISAFRYMAFNSAAFTFNANVGIGYAAGTSVGYQIQLSADSAGKPGTNTWTINSDARLKRNVKPLEGGLSVIDQIVPVEAEYNGLNGTPEGQRVVSVVVEELKKILPGCCPSHKGKLRETDTEETEIGDFNSHEILFHLILAVQQLSRLKS